MTNPPATQTIFRSAIVLMWFCTVLSVILMFNLEHTLPEELLLYLERQANAPLTTTESTLALVGLAMLIMWLVSSIQLFQLKPKGRNWFTLANAIMVVLILFYEPNVSHQYSDAVEYVDMLATGFIIAMCYTTKVLENDA